MRSLRFDGETDDAFRARAGRAARFARVLVDACLANHDVQAMIADPDDPHTAESLRHDPVVRIDYEEAYAIASIGEGIYATRNKHWGTGPSILPIRPDDPVRGLFINYVYKENSRYNRRFEQRRQLKRLLGRKYRPLVSDAQLHTRKIFLESLTAEQAYAIRRLLTMEPSFFWRVARGRTVVDLPSEPGYLDAKVAKALPEKPSQLRLQFERW